MSESVKIFIDDPSKFGLLATQVKLDIIQAAIAAVNQMAGRGRKEAVKNVQVNFTNRNTFTVRQIQFTPMPESKYVKISAIQSFVGVTEKAPWMARQEEGGKHRPSKGQTLAIPTDTARGGSRRRPVAAGMRVGKIGKRRRVRSPERRDYAFWFRSEKARKVARAYMAFKKGLFVPIGDTKDQRNLFVVTHFIKSRRGVAFKLKQIYKFDKPETTTEPEPWLLPASDKVARQAQAIFNAQMKRLGL
jgi:hypothetical protein